MRSNNQKHGQLKNVEIEELSFVDTPANRRKFIILKQGGGQAMGKELEKNQDLERNEDEIIEDAVVEEEKQDEITLKDLDEKLDRILNLLQRGYYYPRPKEEDEEKQTNENKKTKEEKVSEDLKNEIAKLKKELDDIKKAAEIKKIDKEPPQEEKSLWAGVL